MNLRVVPLLRKQLSALSNDDRGELVFAAVLVIVALAAQWIDSRMLNEALRFVGVYGVCAFFAVWGDAIRRVAAPRMGNRLTTHPVALYLVIPATLAAIFLASLGPWLHDGWIARGLLWLGYLVPAILAMMLAKRFFVARFPPLETTAA